MSTGHTAGEGGAPQRGVAAAGPDAVRALDALAGGETPPEVARALVEEAMALLGAAAGGVGWATTPGTLELLHAAGLAPDAAAAFARVPIAAPVPAADVVRTGEAQFLETPEAIAARYPGLDALRRARGDGAWITVPLTDRGVPRGALALALAAPRALDPTDRNLLLALGAAGGAALARAARLEEERALRRAAERFAEALEARALALTEEEERLRAETQRAARHARDLDAARAHAERAVAELDAVLGSIPHGVVVYDRTGQIVRTNAAAEAILGYTTDQRALPIAERLPFFGLLEPDGSPVPVSRWPVTRALAGETVQNGVYKRLPPGAARPSWLSIMAAPIRTASGEQTGAVGAFFDITTEHELAELREDLLRMVSHDLRTPLNAIFTQAHLIRRTAGLPPRVEERAVGIVRTCERMSAMIKDLLEMVLLESGHLQLAPARVDLCAYVRDLLDRFREPLGPGRIRLQCPGAPLHATIDPSRMERVLVNLLTNAIKYSPAESPVDLRLRATGSAAAISVTDRGVGIAPGDVPRIFGRFYRVGVTRQPEGLGLGLYIARLLVEAHRGTIDVETAPGVGSTFTVTLPLA